MRRSLWFAAGASAGVYAAARARRAAEVFTIDGLRDRVGAAIVGARMLRDEVAQGKAEAETELRERITVGLHERRELLARPREADALEHDPDQPAHDPDRPAGRHRQDTPSHQVNPIHEDNQDNQEEGTS